jgi:hypothetical protein
LIKVTSKTQVSPAFEKFCAFGTRVAIIFIRQTERSEVKVQRSEAKKDFCCACGKQTFEVQSDYGRVEKNRREYGTEFDRSDGDFVRSIPVKVLEENRRIINEHLQSRGRGKVSFTHLIAWAIIKAAQVYPQLNNGYGLLTAKPSRLKTRASISESPLTSRKKTARAIARAEYQRRKQ